MGSSPHLSAYLLLGGFLALIAGYIMIRFGRRGRRMDDHPICRKCHYDLSGLPATSYRCPECGADVTSRGAVVVGYSPKAMLRVGMSAMLLGAGVLAWSGYRIVQDIDWIRHRSTSSLLGDLRSAAASPSRANSAYTEVVRRIEAGELDSSQAPQLVEQLMQLQQDEGWTLRWSYPWMVLNHAMKHNLATAEQMQRIFKFAEPAATQYWNSPAVKIPATLRRGRDLRIEIAASMTPLPTFAGYLAATVGPIEIDGIQVASELPEESSNFRSGAPVLLTRLQGQLDWQRLEKLPDGSHELVVRMRLGLRPDSGRNAATNQFIHPIYPTADSDFVVFRQKIELTSK